MGYFKLEGKDAAGTEHCFDLDWDIGSYYMEHKTKSIDITYLPYTKVVMSIQ